MTQTLRVAIDVRVLTVQQEIAGVGQYIDQLLKAADESASVPVQLVPLSFRAHRAGVVQVAQMGRLPWQSFALPWHLRGAGYSLFHGPAFSVPPFTRIPTIATIHDLAFIRYPETVNADTRQYLRRVVPQALHRAARIIVPSSEVRDDLMTYFPNTNESHIRVVPLGADRLRAANSQSHIEMDHPYLLHVGTVEPRKNLHFLLRAFEMLITRYEVPHHLVLLGGVGWKNQQFYDILNTMPQAARVHVMGYVDDGTMAAYYRNAALYVMPSLYEGFGLGALEAAWFGVPVLASPTGGIRDLRADPAVRCVAPNDPNEWADNMHSLLTQPLSPQSQVRTWQQVWLDHVALYREVVRP